MKVKGWCYNQINVPDVPLIKIIMQYLMYYGILLTVII